MAELGLVMSRIVTSKEFEWAIVILALLCGVGIYLFPPLGWYLLLVATIPLLIRLLGAPARFPFSSIDLPLLGFALIAGYAASISYRQATSWHKCQLLLAAIVIYYALVIGSRRNRWALAALLASVSPLVSLYFLFTQSWRADQAKFGPIGTLGEAWMNARPFVLPIDQLHPNVAGGLMAIFVPLLVALIIRGARSRQWAIVVIPYALAMLAITGFGLLLSESRGAWLSLAAAFFAWGLWSWSDFIGETFNTRGRNIFVGVMVILLAQVIVLALAAPESAQNFINQLPGPAQAGSRLALFNATFSLLDQFWLLGAGLDTFSGLYSFHIAISPFLLLTHGHNTLLNVFLELGVVGFICFAAIQLRAFWLLVANQWGQEDEKKKLRHRQKANPDILILQGALLACLTTILLHSFVDDVLFSSRAILLLFAVQAFIVAHGEPKRPSIYAYGVGLAAVPAIVLVLMLVPQVRAGVGTSLQVNRTAIELAQVELSHWAPDAQVRWDDGRNRDQLASIEEALSSIHAEHPDNSAVNFLFGRISMIQRDYPVAIERLSLATAQNRNHEGARQLLGYSHLWSGDLRTAGEMLADNDQTRRELAAYQRLWSEQELPQQATYAARLLSRLEANSN